MIWTEIFTSYFANLKKIPKDMVPISICGKAPDWYKGIQFKKLAPKYWFFAEWKISHDNSFYIKNFNSEVLSHLNQDSIMSELEILSKGKDVALICYEKPGDFCHRFLISAWLKEAGIIVTEL